MSTKEQKEIALTGGEFEQLKAKLAGSSVAVFAFPEESMTNNATKLESRLKVNPNPTTVESNPYL